MINDESRWPKEASFLTQIIVKFSRGHSHVYQIHTRQKHWDSRLTSRYTSQTLQDRGTWILWNGNRKSILCAISNSTVSNDLESPLKAISAYENLLRANIWKHIEYITYKVNYKYKLHWWAIILLSYSAGRTAEGYSPYHVSSVITSDNVLESVQDCLRRSERLIRNRMHLSNSTISSDLEWPLICLL